MLELSELDRYAVAELLNVTDRQFGQLRRNPTFPKPHYDGEYELEEVLTFQAKMTALAARGFRIPEALYRWEVDWPIELAWLKENEYRPPRKSRLR